MSQLETMGSYLRAARRKRRVSIERASEDLKIKADFLMRMESDEFDFLAPAYARGFLRSYARYVGLDEEPFLEEFDRRFGRARIETQQILAIEREKGRLPRQTPRFNRWTMAAAMAAGVLLLLGLVGLFNPQPDEGTQVGARNEAPGDSDAPSEPSPPDSEAGDGASPRPSASASASAPPVSLADGIVLEVSASKDRCWTEVDADGVDNVFYRSLELGESETFTAEEQMTIVLGNPTGVELKLNGKDVTLPEEYDEGEALTIELPNDVAALSAP